MRRALVLTLLIAGCATPALDAPAPDLAPDVGHDHLALEGHTLAWNMARVGGLDLDALLDGEAGRASDLQFHEDLAAVAVNAGAGGFVLLDASDPRNLTVLSRYRSGTDDNWYVKFTPDGRFIVLTANARLPPTPGAALADLTDPTLPHAARGLQVVDITDPSAPALAAVYPSPIRAINAATWEAGGATYVAASVITDRAVGGFPKPGLVANEIHILRLDGAGQPSLVARWGPPQDAGPEVFVHDLSVEVHPLTGATLVYAACWDAGAYLVDVSDPAAPTTVGSFRPEGDTPQVHTVKPHPGLLGGKQYTLTSPETFADQASGRYHLLDTTDPSAPTLVATWEAPGALVNAEPLLWSPHESALSNGTAYTSDFHLGVVALSLPELTPIAAWAAPPEAPREESARWAVDVETVVARDGFVYAVDMGRGLDVLALTP